MFILDFLKGERRLESGACARAFIVHASRAAKTAASIGIGMHSRIECNSLCGNVKELHNKNYNVTLHGNRSPLPFASIVQVQVHRAGHRSIHCAVLPILRPVCGPSAVQACERRGQRASE